MAYSSEDKPYTKEEKEMVVEKYKLMCELSEEYGANKGKIVKLDKGTLAIQLEFNFSQT